MIFGRPGSGKSTFANKLSKEINTPLYHLDKYFYVDNWIERDYQEFLQVQQDIVNQPSWIIDGNSTKRTGGAIPKCRHCSLFQLPAFNLPMASIKKILNECR